MKRSLYLTLAILMFCAVANAKDTHIAEADGVRVAVVTEPFKKERHKLSLDQNGVLLKIDGHEYSGSDGYIPQTEISSMTLVIMGSGYSFPLSTYGSLYNPLLGPDFIHPIPQISVSPKTIAISFAGGDGAGSYDVRWEIDRKSLAGIRYLKEHPNPEKAKVLKFKLKKSNESFQSDPRRGSGR